MRQLVHMEDTNDQLHAFKLYCPFKLRNFMKNNDSGEEMGERATEKIWNSEIFSGT